MSRICLSLYVLSNYGACSAQAARTLVPEPTVERKTCTKCKLHKLSSDFFRFKFSSDGLQSYCKVRSFTIPCDRGGITR